TFLGKSTTYWKNTALRHLFHEQGDAIGAVDDVLPEARRQRVVAHSPVDHVADLALCQPIDCHSHYVGLSDPGRIKLRPKRHDQQHAKGLSSVHYSTEHL